MTPICTQWHPMAAKEDDGVMPGHGVPPLSFVLPPTRDSQSKMQEMVGLLTPKLSVETDLPSSLLSSVTPPCKRGQHGCTPWGVQRPGGLRLLAPWGELRILCP